MKVICIEVGLMAEDVAPLVLYGVYTTVDILQREYNGKLIDFYVLEEQPADDAYAYFLFSPFTDEEEKQLQCQITEKEPQAVDSKW